MSEGAQKFKKEYSELPSKRSRGESSCALQTIDMIFILYKFWNFIPETDETWYQDSFYNKVSKGSNYITRPSVEQTWLPFFDVFGRHNLEKSWVL